ncbi:hypothetical protein C7974DRAFT_119464 [Boeremia exigua]|uniref:uncharacterized protein n=1 Tax=Boeremia exigua TaxID=749465 RepID=UPI001E8E10A0|nr:uncharacterized protein C7974DRAFT_119464 [Boeremia exigua]KAH6643202.1 hypothetical protein C7974DRAFT_119464 [Boeremia exigua]
MHIEYIRRVEVRGELRRLDSSLVMAVWLLSLSLILCISMRLLYSFKQRKSRLSPAKDDVLIVAVGLLGLASMLALSTTVTRIGTPDGTPYAVETSQLQVISYASTISFVFALSLSKMPLVLWLKRLELPRAYRMFTVVTGCMILAHMLSAATMIILQCQLPTPWNIRMGRCTSSHQIWTTVIAIDIVFDMSLTVMPVFAVMRKGSQHPREGWVAIILSLRTFLIVPSLVRLVYLQQPTPNNYIFLLESLPYALATQCQITIAAILSCTPALPCLANLTKHPSPDKATILRKHWSNSSSCSDIANAYFASAPAPVTKQSLPTIQASMAAPPSPPCPAHAVFLPSPMVGSVAKAQAPLRPPPPCEHQRPDMSLFIHNPTVTRPPPVALLNGGSAERLSARVLGRKRSKEENVRTSKHVTFDV